MSAREVCAACGGTGDDFDGNPCPACGGTGEVPQAPALVVTAAPPLPTPPPDGERPRADGWVTPVPLRRRLSPPPFPVDVFPDWLAAMVTATAEFTQTDPAMPAAVALSVLAGCAGGRLEVEARPGWREPTHLFIATVARPGERKTPVQQALVRPLREAEDALVAKAAPKVAEAETRREIAAKNAAQAKAKAANEDGPRRDKLQAEAVSAALAAEAIDVPTLPRLIAGDVTPEALATLMYENAGKVALVADEGGIFDVLAGRYSAIPNLDVFLQGHAGSPLRIDRKGRPPEYVRKPALTVGLMVQPQVLRQVGGNLTFAGRGLIARFLFVLPTTMVGRRRVDPEPVPEQVAQTYGRVVRGLAETLAGWTDPAVVTLTGDAQRAMFAFAQDVEDRLGPGGDLDHVADWAAKLVGAVVRIAGLLHVARHPDSCCRRPVDADTMNTAVDLGRVLTAHYLSAVDEMGANPEVDKAEYVLDVLRRMGQDRPADRPAAADGPLTVTVRDVFTRASRSRLATVDDLAPALDLLEAHGYVRRLPAPDRSGPGRPPSPSYEVNPLALAAETAVSAELGVGHGPAGPDSNSAGIAGIAAGSRGVGGAP
ncbi:MAG: DUF3987 domain-containing protein [Actinobacteria bacterium]|nr:DUF3987 domain-containing protein [Actinomycetota bacterium]